MPDDAPAPSAPALGFSITANINQKRQIVVQSFVPLDAEPAEISKVLDKALDQIDRAENRYLLRDLKLVLENDENTLKQHVEKVADLQNAYQREWMASGRRGDFKLAGVQKTNVENVQKTIEGLKDRVARTKTQIEEISAAVG